MNSSAFVDKKIKEEKKREEKSMVRDEDQRDLKFSKTLKHHK